MKEPKIRFKGFRGEWEEKALGCCVAFWDSMRQPIEEVKRIKGIYPYYGASGVVDYINDYIFDEELILLSEDGANITDRNYPVCFIARGKYWVNNHAHVLKANKGFDNVFLCNNLERKDYTQYNTGMAMPKLNKEVCIRIPVLYPTLPEQQSIASYFQHLDSLIQSTTKKIESLKQVKAASLQSMFPQEGETTPRVRFKGFEGEWEETLLGTIFSERCEYRPNAEMLSVTMNQGVIKASDNGRFDNSNSDKSKYKLVKVDDIAYNSMRMWQGACGCSKYEGIVSPAYTVIVPKEDICPSFFSYMFKTNGMLKVFRLNSQGLTSDTWNLKYPAFSKLSIIHPKVIAEQRAIASYFTNLDRQITLHTQRLEKLKQIKAACLDNMFV